MMQLVLSNRYTVREHTDVLSTGNRIFDNKRSPYIYAPRPVSKTPKMHPENYFCSLSSKFAGCMEALCIPNNRVFCFVFSADFNIFGEK